MSEFVSADGSPLALYLAIPPGDEPGLIDSALQPNSSILELGSGPGRITRVLVALGHEVVAVDDSLEMLEHVTGAERVCADLFHLDLGREFDCVVAGSHLINVPDAEDRHSLLQVCRRHLRRSGIVLMERYAPGWLSDAEPSESRIGIVDIGFEPIRFEGSTLLAEMTYRMGARTWVQRFGAVDMDDETLAAEAEHVGLVVTHALDDRRTWVALERSKSHRS